MMWYCVRLWGWVVFHLLQDEHAPRTTVAAAMCVSTSPGELCVPVLLVTSSLPMELSVKVAFKRLFTFRVLGGNSSAADMNWLGDRKKMNQSVQFLGIWLYWGKYYLTSMKLKAFVCRQIWMNVPHPLLPARIIAATLWGRTTATAGTDSNWMETLRVWLQVNIQALFSSFHSVSELKQHILKELCCFCAPAE